MYSAGATRALCNRVISRNLVFSWASRFPDLTPIDFWFWSYLKSKVYTSNPRYLAELNDAVKREVIPISPVMLHSSLLSTISRMQCVIVCEGGDIWKLVITIKHFSPPLSRVVIGPLQWPNISRQQFSPNVCSSNAIYGFHWANEYAQEKVSVAVKKLQTFSLYSWGFYFFKSSQSQACTFK